MNQKRTKLMSVKIFKNRDFGFFRWFGDLDIVDFHSNGRENFHDHRISIGIGFREPQAIDTTVKTFSSKSYHQKSLIWGDVFWEISITIGKAPAESSTFWPASPLYPILGGFRGTARAAGKFWKNAVSETVSLYGNRTVCSQNFGTLLDLRLMGPVDTWTRVGKSLKSPLFSFVSWFNREGGGCWSIRRPLAKVVLKLEVPFD